jgi:GDP-4-dehydro-6-deoxy-D-mannose reductase
VSGEDILQGLLAHSRSKEIKPVIEQDKLRPVDVPEIFGDNSKVKQDTGWEPIIDLEQTLREVMEDWRERVAQG